MGLVAESPGDFGHAQARLGNDDSCDVFRMV